MTAFNNNEFLGWTCTSEYDLSFGEPFFEFLALFRLWETFIFKSHFGEFVTMNDDSIRLMEYLIEWLSFSLCDIVDSFFSDYVALLCNGGCSDRLVASNHNDFDTCWSALQDCKRYWVSWWVTQRKHSDECLVIEIKVGVFIVEFEPFRIFVFWKMIFGESKDSFSVLSKWSVCLFEFVVPLYCFGNWFSSLIDCCA